MLLDRPSQRRYKLLPCHVLHVLELLFVVTHLQIQNKQNDFKYNFSNAHLFRKLKRDLPLLHSAHSVYFTIEPSLQITS